MGQVEAHEGDNAAGEVFPAGQVTGKCCASTASKVAQTPNLYIDETAAPDSDVRVNDSRLANDSTQLDVTETRSTLCSHSSSTNGITLEAAPGATASADGDVQEEHRSASKDIRSHDDGHAATMCMPRALTALASAAAGVVTSAAALPKRSGKVLLGHGSRSHVSSEMRVTRPGPRHTAGRTSAVKVEAIAARARKQHEAPVALHVYDASWLAPADSTIPIVHLGVEIYGTEFSFGNSGVLSVRPGAYDPARHRQRLLLGHTSLPKREVYRMLINLRKDWPGTCYRLIGCNCQTFALTLCECLGFGACVPEQYTYFAKPWTLAGGVELNTLIPLALSGQLGSNLRSSGSVVDSSDMPGGTELNACDLMDI